MSTRNVENFQSKLYGDTNPVLFNFNTPISRDELLTLYITSHALETAVRFIPTRLMSTGFKFKTDEPFLGEKHGQPFKFNTFVDWIKWNGLYNELINAMSWALLFSRSRIFFYKSDEKPSEFNGKPYYSEIQRGTDICTKSIAMYPFLDGNGWKIAKFNELNEPEIYKVSITQRERDTEDTDFKIEERVHYVHASRVVVFHGVKKELGYEGTALSQKVAHLIKLQKQMLQSVFVSVKNLIAGYLITRARNGEDAKKYNEILDEFSHLTRIYWTGSEDLDDVIKMVVPDFNATQLESINMLIQKQIASAVHVSIRNLGEEDIASGLGEGGAMISHEITKFEIEDMQNHFQRAIEECFFLYGKKDTSLIWNDPNQRDEELRDESKSDELNGNEKDFDEINEEKNEDD